MKSVKNILPVFLIMLIFFGCQSKKKKEDISNMPNDLKQLNELIKNNPDNSNLYHQRAIFYMENQQIDSAFVDIRKAINIDSSKADYFVTLADIYFMQGFVSKSKSQLQKVIQKNPNHVESYLKLAEIHFLYKEYGIMNGLLQKVLELDSKNAKAYFMKGMALKEQGDTARAEIEMLKATNLNQEYYDAYMQLGLINLEKNNPIAGDYFNNAINIRPKSIEAHYALGMFYQQSNEAEKAITSYNNILSINPNYKFAHYNLGWVNLVLSQKYDVAIQHFSDAIELDSLYYEAYYNLGHCYELKNNFSEARKYFKKSLEIETNYELAIEGLNRIDKKSRK